MNSDQILRQQLLALVRGGNAHMSLDQAVAGFPTASMNQNPPNVSYTPWHLLEHIRLAQWDIVEFVINPQHVSPEWPKGYWPAPDAQADPSHWDETLAAIRADLERLEAVIQDPKIDLTAEIPHAPGYTYLREVLLVADHNGYHIGEFAILRQVMQDW